MKIILLRVFRFLLYHIHIEYKAISEASMQFNPFRNRAMLHPFLVGIIAVILLLLGYNITGEVLLVITAIWYIVFQIKRINNKKQKDKREIEFQKYIKRTRASFLSSFDKVFKDGLAMQCFASMENPFFYNVIDKSEEDKGNLYVGELEWVQHMELGLNGLKESTLATRVATKSNEKQVGNRSYATMCVLYDEGFRFPNFDLTKETLGKRTAEKLKLTKSLDIDFNEDKNFSDAWWLTTNEMVADVKDLFNASVRNGFMKYASKNYRIAGQGNMLILITKDALLADEYSWVINDIRSIQRLLRGNKKFYVEPKKSY